MEFEGVAPTPRLAFPETITTQTVKGRSTTFHTNPNAVSKRFRIQCAGMHKYAYGDTRNFEVGPGARGDVNSPVKKLVYKLSGSNKPIAFLKHAITKSQ